MEYTTIDKEKLAYKLLKDWLKSIRLCGSLDRLGFDSSEFRPHYLDDVFVLLSVEITDETDIVIEKYEHKIVAMDFFEFSDRQILNELTAEMLECIKMGGRTIN